MEKSIESIWKQGFLDEKALIVPKINDLYNQKSKDIVERFKRAFKINIIALFIFSFLVLSLSIYYDVLLLGIFPFIIFNSVALYSLKINKEFKLLNQNVNSYEYLKSFDNLLKKHIAINAKLARIIYPTFFIPFLFICYAYGFDYGVTKQSGGDSFQAFLNMITNKEGVIHLLKTSIPTFIIIIILISFFSEKLYRLDIKLVYGRMFKKLDKILSDMEELRKGN